MAQRERSSSRNVTKGRANTGVVARRSGSTSGRVVVRSIKTGQFTRSKIKKAISMVTSEKSRRDRSA